MAGLFDLIKGVALLAGGAKASRMDEEKNASENEYRRESIATKREEIGANKEMAEAQREHTAWLQGREHEHQGAMQEKTINWEEKKMKAQQEFEKSENQLVRANAVTLANLRIEAEKAMQEKGIKSQEGMFDKKLKQDMTIALIDKQLRERGFGLEKQKLSQDFTLGKMGVLVQAVGIAQKGTQGMEGIMTASSRMNPSMASILNAQEQANLKTIFDAIDPKGELGLKGLDINKYVVPISASPKDAAGAADLAGKLGVTLPPQPVVPKPLLNDNVAPPVSQAIPASLAPMGDIHPGDQLGLDKVSSQIMALPDAERATAFGEYNQLINDPANSFIGGADPAYRQKMVRYLGKSTGFDITK